MFIRKLNKNIFKQIFSFINDKITLEIVKFNKNLKSKLDISLYAYQKRYFYTIVTPALLKYKNLFISNNIYDESTINKLIYELENEGTKISYKKSFEIIKIDKNFSNISEITTLSLDNKIPNQIKLYSVLPNLKELNLCNFDDLEIPCSILVYLEILSLTCIKGLKFISKDKNISLNKLYKLYIDRINIADNQDIHFETNNLKYLDL